MIAEAIYTLCALLSIACVILLLRAYFKRRSRILLSCSFCFAALAANNVLLVLDLVFLPNVDLYLLRIMVMALGFFVMLVAFMWEAA